MDQPASGGMPAPDAILDLLFREARTHRSWHPNPISDDDIRAIYDLAKMGPTSGNCQPVRIAFIRSPEAKERLRPLLDTGNVGKTMTAPVTAIVAHDLEFYERFAETSPPGNARDEFVGKPALIEETAFRNGSLQGAYLIMAARSLGFDCGPMSGFDRAAVDREFFAGTQIKSNFLCNIGHGDGKSIRARKPRLAFDTTCRIL